MANGAFKFKDSYGNTVSFISGSGSDISFSGGTLNLSGMTGITLGNLTLSGTTQNATSASHAASYLLTSSFNTYTGDTNTIIGTLATTGSNLFKGNQTISGSVIPAVTNTYDLGSATNQFRHLYLSSASLYIDGTKVLGSTSQELQITTDVGQSFKILEAGSDNITLQSADGNIEFKTSGGGDVVIDPTNGIIGLKGTVTVYTGNKVVSSDGNSIQFGNGISVTGSILSTVTPLVSGSSQIIYSGLTGVPSGIISGSSQITSQGYAITGSNNFQGTQTITGSLYISSDLVVQGSSSLQNITASVVNIGANIVNLNTANPAIRFAGLSIFDSGSIGGSGSFLYDAVQDEFIFVHRGDGANITSSVVMMGPQTYNNVGSEIYPTTNRILKGTGNEHIGDSIISEIDGGIGINGSLSVTGSVTATNFNLTDVGGGAINNQNGNLFIQTTAGAGWIFRNGPSGYAEYMRLTASGNLSVGNTNDTYKLDVSGTGRFTNDLRVGQASASTNVQFILNGVANKSQRILFQNSGTDQWLLGAGSASETSAFELYNATGTIVLSVNKTTNASTFSNTLQANGKIFLQRASTGADTLLQFKNEAGVDKAYIKFGGVDEELAFYAGAGGTRNLIIGPSGEMAFNTSTVGVRSYLFKALSGRQLAIEALESGGVHSIYLRPSSSGRNLIASNYFSGGVYLPLALSGRENDTDLVLHANGNISMGSATDGGVRLSITGANSGEGQLYVGNTDVTYSAGVNFTTAGTNRGFVGWRHTNSGAPFTLTGIHLFNTDNSNIVFGTNNTVKAVINVDGNLGINDTNPGTRLSVNGANYVEMATFACTTDGAAAIVSSNSGYVQFSSGNARHCSNTSLFVPVTDGIRITKAGIVYVTFSQDITTAGTTGYVAGYIQKNKSTISENLITNTGGQWDGINGCITINVAANDVINFSYNASEILSFDPNTWSQYSFVWTSR